jgi:hypothetical protein
VEGQLDGTGNAAIERHIFWIKVKITTPTPLQPTNMHSDRIGSLCLYRPMYMDVYTSGRPINLRVWMFVCIRTRVEEKAREREKRV